MPHWNLFADDVAQERRTLRLSARPADLAMGDSYKAQALRELARRLNLEETLTEVLTDLAAAITRYEAAEEALHQPEDTP